jgi:hypothetical protein
VSILTGYGWDNAGIQFNCAYIGCLLLSSYIYFMPGHPDFVHIGDQIAELLSSPEESQVVVIGQGNVALDCAR